MERRHQLNFWYFIIALFGVLLVQQWWQQTQTVDVVPYSEFEQMLKDGKITESIELFAEAAKGMPRNPIINLNAAQSLIAMMKNSQPTRSALEETLSYIRAANDCETHKERQSRLLAVCRELSACL